jgi:hypothetical protein
MEMASQFTVFANQFGLSLALQEAWVRLLGRKSRHEVHVVSGVLEIVQLSKMVSETDEVGCRYCNY